MGYATIAAVRKSPSRRYNPWLYNTEYHVRGMAIEEAWDSLQFDRGIRELTTIVQSDTTWHKEHCAECHVRVRQIQGRCWRCHDTRFVRNGVAKK